MSSYNTLPLIEPDYAAYARPVVFSKPRILPRQTMNQTDSSSASSRSLDLGELRKTQKRVAFLLQRSSQHTGNVSTIFPKPTYQGKCFLCRNNIGDPHTHYQPRRNVEDKLRGHSSRPRRNSIVIPSEWGVSDNARSTPSSRGPSIWSAQSGPVKKKVAFPIISDNQRISGLPRTENDRVRSKNYDNDAKNEGDNRIAKYKELSTKTGKGRLPIETIKHITNMAGIATFAEADSDEEESEKCGIRPTNTTEIDQDSRRQDSAVVRLDTPAGGSRQGLAMYLDSVSAYRTGKYFRFDRSKLSPESTERSSSGKWCECAGQGECRECSRKVGHEKWCRFETGECPDCGKPVKGKHRVKSRSAAPGPFTTSPTNYSVSVDGSDGLMSQGTRSIENDLLKPFPTKKMKSKKRRTAKKGVNKKHNSLKERRDEAAIDPNIHRQAYVLALADSRLRKWKSETWTFNNITTQLSFSYFSLWRNPRFKCEAEARSESVPRIGIRGQEMKVKMKNPMKHILGSLKLSDYYPGGKRWLGVEKKIDD